MHLRLGAACRARGVHLGTLWGVTVEPTERLLLRLVVEEPQARPLRRVRVPFGRLDGADGDQVALSVSSDEFRALPEQDPAGAARAAGPARRRRGETPVEKLLTASTRVACRDGEVGRLGSLSFDSRSGDLEDISFAFGVPLTRDLVVPVRCLDEIGDDRISLALAMNDLEQFPSRSAS